MSMPTDLVLVRHGQSEPNVMQKSMKKNPKFEAPAGFYDRHDSRMRLTAAGRDQATQTGTWINESFPAGFDRYYVSALTRTIETAGQLAIDGSWVIDDRWRERDWGEYLGLNEAEQEAKYERSAKLRGQSKWYWAPPGGESLATGVRLRFGSILESLHRELSGRAVIAVTHGETMEVARLVLERVLPEEWTAQEQGDDFKLANCHILHYSRRNPLTGGISDRLEWRRSICAWASEKSWDEGRWTFLRPKQYGDGDLLELAQQHRNLLG
jgi:broad specificity phosphatase PhoE